jgi:hypothetical protein
MFARISVMKTLNGDVRIGASRKRLLRVSVVRREETRAYEIFEPARPGLVCVAPYVHAHGDQGLFRCNNPGIKIDIKDEVRNLLNSAGDRNLGTQFFRKIGVAAAILLKVCLARFILHRRNVDDFQLSRLCYSVRNC